MLSSDAIAAAVKAEIERQQKALVYDELSEDELEKVIESLSKKLEMAKAALEKAGKGAAPAAPAMVAPKKAEGGWPELPWGVAGAQDAAAITAYIEKSMSERQGLERRLASRAVSIRETRVSRSPSTYHGTRRVQSCRPLTGSRGFRSSLAEVRNTLRR